MPHLFLSFVLVPERCARLVTLHAGHKSVIFAMTSTFLLSLGLNHPDGTLKHP